MANDYLQQVNKQETNPLLVSLRAFAIKHNVPIITEEGLRFIHQLIQLKQIKRVLEIGTAIGYSALSMAINDDVYITTIERDPVMIERAKKNFAQSNVAEKITLIERDALDVDEQTIEPVDMIFIDAAKAQSINFFNKYKSILKPQGIIVTDNLLFHGLIEQEDLSKNLSQLVRKIDNFNHFVVEQEDFDTAIYEIGDGMSLSIKKGVSI